MSKLFFENITPISNLKTNSSKIIAQTCQSSLPTLITKYGQGVAVVQSLSDFEKAAEERKFLKAIGQGLIDLNQGQTKNLDEARLALNTKKA